VARATGGPEGGGVDRAEHLDPVADELPVVVRVGGALGVRDDGANGSVCYVPGPAGEVTKPSRRLNFWILPDAVRGKVSTKTQCWGVL